MNETPILRPAALRRNVADILRARLLEGKFKPGEEISDSQLASEFMISRGPIREALLLLAEEGLLIHRHNRGFEVPRLDRQDMRQITEVRYPLEVLALKLAQQQVTPDKIIQMETLKSNLLEAFRNGGIKMCATPDFAFHSAVWELSGNPWLGAALRRISMPFFAYVSAFGLGRPDQSLELLDSQHQCYIDFLARKSSETAEKCVAFHIQASQESQGLVK